MKKVENYSSALRWFAAIVPVLIVTGCGGGSDSAPILGGISVGGVPPIVSAVTPAPNAIGVATNTKVISAAFTKAMEPASLNSSSFTLACPGTSALVGTTVGYFAAGNLSTLTLSAANLPPSTVCAATIFSTARDTAGNALLSNFNWTFTTGLSPDTTAPTVTGTINANGAINVETNTKVVVTFSEAMAPATITTSTFTLKNGTTVVPGSVSYSGVSAIFTPAITLAPGTQYTATVTSDTKDVSGNTMANDYVWRWTTTGVRDTTAPTVPGTINANGATNVAINTKIGATFSESLDPLTLTAANFNVKQGINQVPGVVSYSGVNAVFVPLSNLQPNTVYTVTVKGGSDGVADLAGNVLVGDFTWNWTTSAGIDTTAPTITGTFNANGTTNVPGYVDLGAIFSEGMDPLTITNQTFTLRHGATAVTGTVAYQGLSALFIPSSNLSITAAFIPSETLLPGTLYTVTVTGGAGGVADLAGNVMVSDYVWSWTTAPAPSVTAP